MNRSFCLLLFISLCLASFVGCSRDPNVRKQRYFESGQRYFDKGKYREALIQFGNAVQVDGRFVEAHHQMARAYLRTQQWTPAYHELVRTIELQPENYDARLDLVNLLIAGRDLKQAQEQTDWLIEKQPGSAMAHATYADLLAAEDKTPAATQEIQKAISLDPSRWEWYLNLGSMQIKTNQAEAAEFNFRKAVELNPKSITPRLVLAGYYESRGNFSASESQLKSAMGDDPKNPEPLAALVRVYMTQGKKEQAEEALKPARRDFPDNSVGYRMLGDFYFAIGDVDRAMAEYTAVYREHPNDLQVKKNYTQLLILKNQLDDASKIDNEILKVSQSDKDGLVFRGQIQIRQGNAKEAINTLQAALRGDPNYGAAYYHLGVAFDHVGDAAQAESAYQNAARVDPDLSEAHLAIAKYAVQRGDMAALEQSADQLIRLRPAAPGGYAIRALSFVKRGRFNDAERDASRAIGLAPKAPDGYMQMGNLRMAEKKYTEATDFYRQTLDRDPSSADALGSLMKAYFAQGQTEKAFSAVQMQISKVPGNSAFYDLLGTARFEHRKSSVDLDAAESALKKSAELNEHNADAWLKLSQVQAAKAQVDEAIATSQSALQSNPRETEFYVLIGRLYESKGNWAEATQSYQKALEIDPRNPQASNNLAYALAQTGGNLDIALSLAQTARRGMPNSDNVADTLGWVLYQKGAYKSAIDSFQQALSLTERNRTPDNPNVRFHLGLAYQKSGQPVLARQELQRLLRIAPHYSKAEEVRRVLAQLGDQRSSRSTGTVQSPVVNE